MPQAMTFNSLRDDVRNYLERGASAATDPIVYEQIPKLINFAERRIARDIKIQGFQTVVVTNMVAGESVIPKPDRWRETISMNVATGSANSNTRTTVFTRGYEYVRAYWPDDTQVGQPVFYCDYDYQHWLFAPTPDQNYPIEILYYELPPLLDESQQQNWLTNYAPNALLYGTLLEATPFLKNDERIPTWLNFYQMAVESLNTEDLKKVIDRSTTRQEA
jgi:hypothetical protein